MSTEVLACPSCRAPGPMGPDASGEYRCIYCGTRFRRTPTAAAPAPVPLVVNVTAPANKSSAAGVLIAVGLIGLIGAGAAFFLFLAPGEVTVGPSPSDAAERAPARASPSSPEHTPPSVISTPAPIEQEPVPEPPATATFEFHRVQSAYQTSFYALGFVTNSSPFIIDKAKVIVVLLDAQGNEVGTDFGYGERDVLAPAERSPIKILVSEPPEHASIRYEVIAGKASYIPAQAAGLRIEPTSPRPATYGENTWEFEGKVHNEGQQRAKFVSIEIQALDAEGKLVGLGTTYADGDVLAPGAVARYSTQITLADKADHFEFVVGSRVAD
jgi:hypothetical protein